MATRIPDLHDVLKYQAETQALLKTVLHILEQQTGDASKAQKENADTYARFLKETTDRFEVDATLKQ